jgi:hypothetical protein
MPPSPIARAFTTSPYLAEQKPNANNSNDKTTHFGFESIAESLKESKGYKQPHSPLQQKTKRQD